MYWDKVCTASMDSGAADCGDILNNSIERDCFL